MFKEENRMWLYFLGIVVMFIFLAFVTVNFLIPILIRKEKKFVGPVVDAPPEFVITLNTDYKATVRTNLGSFDIDLYEQNAPQNVNNFVFLSTKGFYNGTSFHRLFPDLLIQGGDPNTKDNNLDNDGKGGPRYVVPDEVNFSSLSLSSDRVKELENQGYKSNLNVFSRPLEEYSIAMANDGPNTNGSQFFIILSESSDERLKELNGRFTVIGKVISGFDVIAKIKNTKIDNLNSSNPRPVDAILVEQIAITPAINEN